MSTPKRRRRHLRGMIPARARVTEWQSIKTLLPEDMFVLVDTDAGITIRHCRDVEFLLPPAKCWMDLPERDYHHWRADGQADQRFKIKRSAA